MKKIMLFLSVIMGQILFAGPQLAGLALESNATSINIGERALLTVNGVYADGHREEVTEHIVWEITPADSAEIKGNILTAKKDGQVNIKAKIDNLVSDTLMLDIYWEVNGYRLPPEPDKTLNDSTLLGIDSNNNGVRDDVERWIYETYKDKHPIHIDIAMQAARAYRKILETPERAREIYSIVDKASYCELYYKLNAKYFNEPILVTEEINSRYFKYEIYFNTQDRKDKYIQYDTLLSGYSYPLPPFQERKRACDFNTSKYEK